MNPAIVLVSPSHAAVLLDEFGRYRRDYDLHSVGSAGAAEARAERVLGEGGQVAMFVAELRLPDAPVITAFARWRAVVPSARRLIAAHYCCSAPTLPVCGRAWPRERSTPTS